MMDTSWLGDCIFRWCCHGSIMRGKRVTDSKPKAVKAEHPLQWLAEPLLDEPTFVLKSWFGGRTIMLSGNHQLFLTTQTEPWQGVLVCTFRERHEALIRDFPSLKPHPVLGKWLYLPESCETFETDARRLVKLIKQRDQRIGVPPSAKKKRKVKPIRFGDKL